VLGNTALCKLRIKKNVTFTRVDIAPPPPPTLKRRIFLDIKHLYRAWVADAAGFRVR
jgi:hypothetical protein